jgi:hypothetical protein
MIVHVDTTKYINILKYRAILGSETYKTYLYLLDTLS